MGLTIITSNTYSNVSISYIPSMSLHPNQYLIATGQLHGKEPEHSVSGCFDKIFCLVQLSHVQIQRGGGGGETGGPKPPQKITKL